MTTNTTHIPVTVATPTLTVNTTNDTGVSATISVTANPQPSGTPIVISPSQLRPSGNFTVSGPAGPGTYDIVTQETTGGATVSATATGTVTAVQGGGGHLQVTFTSPGMGSLLYDSNNATDIGDFVDPDGGFVQGCKVLRLPQNPGFGVFFRQDKGANLRNEIVFEYGWVATYNNMITGVTTGFPTTITTISPHLLAQGQFVQLTGSRMGVIAGQTPNIFFSAGISGATMTVQKITGLSGGQGGIKIGQAIPALGATITSQTIGSDGSTPPGAGTTGSVGTYTLSAPFNLPNPAVYTSSCVFTATINGTTMVVTNIASAIGIANGESVQAPGILDYKSGVRVVSQTIGSDGLAADNVNKTNTGTNGVYTLSASANIPNGTAMTGTKYRGIDGGGNADYPAPGGVGHDWPITLTANPNQFTIPVDTTGSPAFVPRPSGGGAPIICPGNFSPTPDAPTAPAYHVDITQDGILVASVDAPNHNFRARWRWNPTPRPIRKTLAQLHAKKWLPIWDGTKLSAFSQATSSMSLYTYVKPMDSCGLVHAQGSGGVQSEMLWVGDYQAYHLMWAGKPDNAKHAWANATATMLAQAEANASWPGHWRELSTNAYYDPFAPGSTYDSYTYPSTDPNSVGSPVSTWGLDTGHFPQLCAIPFMLTGDPYYLENLQDSLIWTGAMRNPAGTARFASGGRYWAWPVRDCLFASVITPTSAPVWIMPQTQCIKIANAWRATRDGIMSLPPVSLYSYYYRQELWNTDTGGTNPGNGAAPSGTMPFFQQLYISIVMAYSQYCGIFPNWATIAAWGLNICIDCSSGTSGWHRQHPVSDGRCWRPSCELAADMTATQMTMQVDAYAASFNYLGAAPFLIALENEYILVTQVVNSYTNTGSSTWTILQRGVTNPDTGKPSTAAAHQKRPAGHIIDNQIYGPAFTNYADAWASAVQCYIVPQDFSNIGSHNEYPLSDPDLGPDGLYLQGSNGKPSVSNEYLGNLMNALAVAIEAGMGNQTGRGGGKLVDCWTWLYSSVLQKQALTGGGGSMQWRSMLVPPGLG